MGESEMNQDSTTQLLAFDRPNGGAPLCVSVKYMELSDIDEKNAVVVIPAYQDSLPVNAGHAPAPGF